MKLTRKAPAFVIVEPHNAWTLVTDEDGHRVYYRRCTILKGGVLRTGWVRDDIVDEVI